MITDGSDGSRRRELPHLVLAAGSTETARIDGLSAAGADPALLEHTPSADAELLVDGAVDAAPTVPTSPTGCPTPALVTRAARDVLDFDATIVDAGLASPTAAPTVDVGASPGDDVRRAVAVRDAEAVAQRARDWARTWTTEHSVDRVAVAETIPGGTTTALVLLRGLGERGAVSSSLPSNPLDRKRTVVDDGLAASDLEPGDCAGRPLAAIRAVGDPVQATLVGLVEGALAAGADVALWGGTQMLAVVAALRHGEVDDAHLRVATTSYVADDDSAAVRALAADLDVDLAAAEPGFAGTDHVGMERFAAGEAKEGVGMGGALGLAAERGRLPAVRERFARRYAALVEGDGTAANAGSAGSHRAASEGGGARGP